MLERPFERLDLACQLGAENVTLQWPRQHVAVLFW